MIKTAYSFRKAVGSIRDIETRLNEIGWKYFPIADIGNSFGFHEINMTPVYGTRLFVTENMESDKPKYVEVILYARNNLSEITKLISLATEQFHYIPLLHYNQIPEDITVIWGNGTKFDLVRSKEKFIALNAAMNSVFVKNAVRAGFKTVATQINDYPNPNDRALYETLCGMNAETNTYPQHILSDEEFRNSLIWIDDKDLIEESIRNRDAIFETHSNVKVQKGSLYNIKTDKSLRELCFEKLKEKNLHNNETYVKRLEFELSIINQKNFDNYFLIVKELIDYAKSKSIVGPGRGSSAGSLVTFLLGITVVDPIKYNLLFFRFLDPNRTDFPDIDSDVASDFRRDVISFAEQRFGKDHVACVGAIATFQANNTIQEFARTYNLPFSEFENLKKMVPDYAAGDDRSDLALSEAIDIEKKTLKKYPEIDVTRGFGGSPRQSTTHAGGIIISDSKIYDFTAVDSRYSEKRTANVDLKTAEKLNLLKIDLLGLKALSIYTEAIEQANLPKDVLYNLDYLDTKPFSLLDDGKFTGIFQIEGAAVWNFAKRVKFKSLEDLSTISAIARPGPMASGDAERWLRRHNGEENVTYPHEVLEPYLKDTLGVLVYQEQVMLIAKEVANMSWEQVAKLRKAISKSMGEEALLPYSEPFISGLVEAGIPETIATKFWQDILGFGSYSFNRSHSLAYGMISYWSLWLKYYHPLEFFAATLTYQDELPKQIRMLREAVKEGYEYIPVDRDSSITKWTVKNGKLLGPLQNIEGIALGNATKILSARNDPHCNLSNRLDKLLTNPVTPYDDLYPVKKKLETLDIYKYSRVCRKLEDAAPNGDWQRDVYIMGEIEIIAIRDENDEKRVSERMARGQIGKYDGETRFIEIRLKDDTFNNYYVKVGRKDFHSMLNVLYNSDGDYIVKDGDCLFVKGTVCPEAPVLLATNILVGK